MDVIEMKAALRKSIQNRLRLLALEELRARSAMVQDRLLVSEAYKSARRVGVYLSMPSGEVATQAIVEHALGEGKEVFVPHLHKNPGITHTTGKGTYSPKRVMNMVSLHSLQDYRGLEKDKWGIPSPDEQSLPQRKSLFGEATGQPVRRQFVTEGLDLIVMPGVAFDLNCNRLGHGRGFYDFFLAEYREAAITSLSPEAAQDVSLPILVALSLPEQLLPEGEIPTEPHDRTLDMIMTDSDIIHRKPLAL